jgi:hypothetical protein
VYTGSGALEEDGTSTGVGAGSDLGCSCTAVVSAGA